MEGGIREDILKGIWLYILYLHLIGTSPWAYLATQCEPQSESNEIDQKPFVQIGWVLRETTCWNEYAFLDSPDQSQDLFPTYYNKPDVRLDLPGYSNHTNYARLNQTQHQCDNVITLPEVRSLIRPV